MHPTRSKRCARGPAIDACVASLQKAEMFGNRVGGDMPDAHCLIASMPFAYIWLGRYSIMARVARPSLLLPPCLISSRSWCPLSAQSPRPFLSSTCERRDRSFQYIASSTRYGGEALAVYNKLIDPPPPPPPTNWPRFHESVSFKFLVSNVRLPAPVVPASRPS